MGNKVEKRAFLIGNGINRAIPNDVQSWSELLKSLAKAIGTPVDLSNELKPFPLLFEEILFKTKGDYDDNLKMIKGKIADAFRNTPATHLHKAVIATGVRHILTTNYDYAFEKAIDPAFSNESGQREVSTYETLNSIKRRTIFQQPELSIWHMHGEIHDNKRFESIRNFPSKSIMIGYEHYSQYIGEMQKYLRGEVTKSSVGLFDRMAKKDFQEESWIDLFFTHDLAIAGLSFDFSEHHLWWLINYRAKQKRRKKGQIKNRIRYYYAVLPEADPNDLNEFASRLSRKKANAAKTDLFRSLDVEPVPIACSSYEDYYLKMLEADATAVS
ncbi:MAG: SIR2 family protein [Bacteroidetes bacterium]|nr:SIR2 family protein [Bacteroidota bacterium]